MRDFIVQMTVALYLVFSFILFGMGAGGNRPSPNNWCQEKPVRIIKIFPTYKLGCYLFSKEE